MPKKIDVAVSSVNFPVSHNFVHIICIFFVSFLQLVDLKAELFRKQGEFLKKKTINKSTANSDELYVKNKV